MNNEPYIEFPKIPRLSRECVITEKIDGTNALIEITPYDDMCGVPKGTIIQGRDARFDFQVGSRTRWITPESDNFGFARWCYDNTEKLIRLGPGRHFGEWWGQGVGRRYEMDQKVFSLFNSFRWVEVGQPQGEKQATAPDCCRVVPILYRGVFSMEAVDETLNGLKERGSIAAPGFMNPEGIIVYHEAAKTYFKKTLDKDDEYKGKSAT